MEHLQRVWYASMERLTLPDTLFRPFLGLHSSNLCEGHKLDSWCTELKKTYYSLAKTG